MKLSETELMNINGGALKGMAAWLMGIGALITLLTGIIDGYLNPLKCNI